MSLWIDFASWLALLVAMPRWIAGLLRGRYCWRDLSTRLFGRVPQRTSDQPCLWLHAPSLGEMNVLLKLLPQIERQYPECELVITSATTSGYELARNAVQGHCVTWFPMAFSWAAKAALRRIRPSAMVFIEMELSPTLLSLARAQGVPLFVVNGRISERQQRVMQTWKSLAAKVLGSFDRILLQTHSDAAPFLAFGARPEQLVVTGSIKLDCVGMDRHNRLTERLRELAGIAADDVVLIAGSTKAGEEASALAAFCQLAPAFPNLRLLLVPRNASRFGEVGELLEASGRRWQRRSQLAHEGADPHCRILLVDCVGELHAWWGAATIAFVGGSLHAHGGQNMIEPAAYGVAVCFGPNTQNFSDVVSLLTRSEAAVVVRNESEFTAFVHRCLSEPVYAQTLGWRARQMILQQSGAIAATLAELAPRLTHLDTSDTRRTQIGRGQRAA